MGTSAALDSRRSNGVVLYGKSNTALIGIARDAYCLIALSLFLLSLRSVSVGYPVPS